MTMKVRYTTIDGEVIAEERDGLRSLYSPDAIGSTLALLDNTQTKTDTFMYWPYGETRTHTGTNPTALQYAGTAGYYRDGSTRTHVRARPLDPQKGRWTSQDPIGWDGGDWNLYRYASNNPASLCDPSGERRLGVPPALQKCLSAKAQRILLAKFQSKKCAAAIRIACKAGGLAAINDTSLVPSWTFPHFCDTADHGHLGACFMAPVRPPGVPHQPGKPCSPTRICINQGICTGDPRVAACAVIWELGNACQCKFKGDIPGEGTAAALLAACGCGGLDLIPGGDSRE